MLAGRHAPLSVPATRALATTLHARDRVPLARDRALLAWAARRGPEAPFGAVFRIACGVALVGAVVAAVHHAEIVAHGSASRSARWCCAAVTAIESS
jgi:hypothetical protein